MHLWRTWLRVNTLMTSALARELQQSSSLSLPDFEVLVTLTDATDDRLRVSELGRALQWEKSRLSHHLRRMGTRGLVERTECAEDARGAFIAVTAKGRAEIEKAAPDHVRAVRRLVFDDFDPAQQAQVSEFLDRTLARLEDDPVDVCAG
ncbi:MAG: MarR family transcriptional regulator [Myxococcales bacterium]|nr:MAG: MarR family transcriptional regulator [Myxococcales bacterium]